MKNHSGVIEIIVIRNTNSGFFTQPFTATNY